MTAAESTSSLTPLNSTSVCLCVFVSLCVDIGYDVCLGFKNGICATVCDTMCECAYVIFVSGMSVMLVWELIQMYQCY